MKASICSGGLRPPVLRINDYGAPRPCGAGAERRYSGRGEVFTRAPSGEGCPDLIGMDEGPGLVGSSLLPGEKVVPQSGTG